jgi:hypothetical protein
MPGIWRGERNAMKKFIFLLAPWPALPAAAQQPFLDQSQWQAWRAEANGTAPYENPRACQEEKVITF